MLAAATDKTLNYLIKLTNAAAQEGYYGIGHDKWHQGFYSTLKRNDGGSCCNLMACRPTQSRMSYRRILVTEGVRRRRLELAI
jgi:hypothetical protein